MKLPLIKVDSNIYSELAQNHLFTHTYTDAFAIHCLQKLWNTYYYASAYPYDHVDFQENLSHADSSYEHLLLTCLSTSSLQICLDGATGTRNDKVRNVANFPPARKHLHVCTYSDHNCGICEKCRRTLLAADAEGKLEAFKDVFPVKYYKEHINEYYDFLCKQHVLNSELYRETFDKLYALHKEDFDYLLSRYELSAVIHKNKGLDDAFQRWIKYATVYRNMTSLPLLRSYILSRLHEKRIQTVAFYGNGEFRRLFDQLLKPTDVQIQYLVEEHINDSLDYPCYPRAKEDFSDVDAVIVTDVKADDIIIDKINRTNMNCLLASDLLLLYLPSELQIKDSLQKKVIQLEAEVKEKEAQIQKLKRSKAYKVGKAITYIPKKASQLIK